MALLTKCICLNLIFVLCCFLATAEKMLRPHFKQTKIWADDVHISHTIAYDEQEPHMNFTFDVLKDLNDLDVHIETKFAQKHDSTYFTTINSTINLCRILAWQNKSPIGALIYNLLKGYGKLADKCPIEKGKYYMHKMWYPEEATFANAPEIDFDIHITAHHLDASGEREKILEDLIKGEMQIKDVNHVKNVLPIMLTGKY